MNTIRFKCPYCGQLYEGAASDIGALANCSMCGKSFTVSSEFALTARKRPSGIACYFGIFKRYFVFSKRMPRREFWWAFFFHTLFLITAQFIGTAANYPGEGGSAIVGLYSLATLVPFFAMQSRRLHDTNKSAWWILLFALPVVNIAYFVWLATPGDRGANRFGDEDLS